MFPFTRSQFLHNSTYGIGSLALAYLLNEDRLLADVTKPMLEKPHFDTLPKRPHFEPRAKAMISLFMQGGPSQIDLFEHKPRLVKEHGKPIPFSRPKDEAEDAIEKSKLLGPVAPISRRGQCGMWWSDLLPNLAEYNPGVQNQLAHLATLARDEEAYWQGELGRLLPSLLLPGKAVRRARRAGGRAGGAAPGGLPHSERRTLSR